MVQFLVDILNKISKYDALKTWLNLGCTQITLNRNYIPPIFPDVIA
jgi:hypothetical protein